MVMPAYPWAAFRLLLQHDVVSIHTPMMETALLSVLASITGRKVVATHHGDLLLPKRALNGLIMNVMFSMFRFMAKRAGRLIAYSHDYADHSYYLRPVRDKVSVIYPPIEIPLPKAERVAQLRAQWSHHGGPVIGYAGRFVEEKRPDLAIKALGVVSGIYPNARLIFAGEYDLEYEDTWQRHSDLVEAYKERLLFLGLISDMQELADFYAACDVLVLSSDSECFALVQVEAMLCGTPLVMTDIPGGRVPVTVTGMGRLAESGNWRSIGEALVEVLSNPEKYHRPREYVEECFSLRETVDRYEKHLRNHTRAS